MNQLRKWSGTIVAVLVGAMLWGWLAYKSQPAYGAEPINYETAPCSALLGQPPIARCMDYVPDVVDVAPIDWSAMACDDPRMRMMPVERCWWYVPAVEPVVADGAVALADAVSVTAPAAVEPPAPVALDEPETAATPPVLAEPAPAVREWLRPFRGVW